MEIGDFLWKWLEMGLGKRIFKRLLGSLFGDFSGVLFEFFGVFIKSSFRVESHIWMSMLGYILHK